MADILINNFQRGVADSEFLGHSVIANLDVYQKKGITSLNYASYPTSGVSTFIKWGLKDPISGNTFGLASDGTVYELNENTGVWTLKAGNDVTNAQGNGLAVWKNYLFVARAGFLDVMKISNSTWTNSWQVLEPVSGLSGTNSHMMLWALDDILYIGNGRYVASVAQNVGQVFDPGNAATYTVNLQALDLPSYYEVSCLAELGSKLMIGTKVANDTLALADIFPWDRSSPTFDLPIRIGENGVRQMITRNNSLYAVCGNTHTVYITNGSSAQKLKSIATLLREENSGSDIAEYTTLKWPNAGSICIIGGKIYMGIKSIDGSADGATNRYPIGVWSIDQNNNFAFEQEFSSLGNSFSTSFEVGALFECSDGQVLSMSLSQGGIYVNDLVDMRNFATRYLYTDYKGFIESQIFQPGTTLIPRTFQQLEFSLAKPLFTGQGIKIKYRINESDIWTTLGTYDFATYGAISSFNTPFGVQAETIQIRVEITQSGTYASPELLEIRLI